MSTTTKNIEVIIPQSIKSKVENNDYKIIGTQVRDKKGRIVCNLDSLESEVDRYFSPKIFQFFEGCSFISCSIVSHKLQRELKKVESEVRGLNSKIDKVITSQTNDLISAITEFDEHFNSLTEGSSLTSSENAFGCGVKAAALLASHIQSYLDDFRDSTVVFYDNNPFKGEKYNQYMENKGYKRPIHHRETERFVKHQANFFSYSFLKVLNNVNLLCVVYNNKVFPRYEENLIVLENSLKELLDFLVNQIGEEGDIYDIYYSLSHHNRKPYPINIKDFLKYDINNNLDDLILRNFNLKTNSKLKDYEDRILSVNNIIEILEEIENLKSRLYQLNNLELSNLVEIKDIKREVFKIE